MKKVLKTAFIFLLTALLFNFIGAETTQNVSLSYTNESYIEVRDPLTVYNGKVQTPIFLTYTEHNEENVIGVEELSNNEDFIALQEQYFSWEITGTPLNAGIYNVHIDIIQDGFSIKYGDTIIEKGEGGLDLTYTIYPFYLNDSNSQIVETDGFADVQTYTGVELMPRISLTTDLNYNENEEEETLPNVVSLTQGTDFTVAVNGTAIDVKYSGNTVVGYSVSIFGTGNYAGTLTTEFKIVPRSIVDSDWVNNEHDITWDKTPLWDSEIELQWSHYESDKKLTLQGSFDWYAWWDENEDEVNLASPVHYTPGNEPAAIVLSSDDYDESYTELSIGDVVYTITGKGNWTGSFDVEYSLVPATIRLNVQNGHHVYNGLASIGGARVNVLNTYLENIGTEQNPNYQEQTINYTLSFLDLTALNEDVNFDDIDAISALFTTYNASKISEANFANAGKVNAGTYKYVYKVECDNYQTAYGGLTLYISKANNILTLSKNGISISSLILTVPSESSIDWQTTYPIALSDLSISTCNLADISKTINANNKSGTITFTPYLNGDITLTITAAGNDNINDVSVELSLKVKEGTITATISNSTYTYDGNAHAFTMISVPSDVTTLYTWEVNGITHQNNIIPSFTNAGRYLVSYRLSKPGYTTYYGTANFVINPKNINDASVEITFDANGIVYDGSAKTPSVIIEDNIKTLKENVDYVLRYTNNIYPTDTAEVQIEGTGNYTGTKTLQFTIESAQLAYTKTNGVAEFTNYFTYGNSPKASIEVIAPNYTITYGTQSGSYDLTTMPKFKDVGVHTVYFKIEAVGFETVKDSLTITITKRYLKVPVVFGEYFYTGLAQSPAWLNYNSTFMEIEGDNKAITPGVHSVTFKLKDKVNTEWETHDTGDKVAEWVIQNISVKDHESVASFDVAYNEWKQINVTNGRTTFDRVGYNQIGWVESCHDEDDSVLGIDTNSRVCNYSRYITINEVPHLNNFDIASSISGQYVAEQVNYNEEQDYDLYAVWTTNTYNVRYNLCDNDGCGIFRSTPTTIASYDHAFTVANPIRDGYLFMGWEITNMDDTPHVIGEESNNNTSFTTPEEWIGLTQEEKREERTISCKNLTSVQSATVNFRAIWSPVKYRIVFNDNKDILRDDFGEITTAELTGIMEDVYPVTYGREKKLPKNTYVLNGYTFTGWNTVSIPTVDNPGISIADEGVIKDLTDEEDGVIVLYAQWQRNETTTFKITYWKQQLGAGNTHNATNYEIVGIETYSGTSDGQFTITPYEYQGVSKSENKDANNYITSNSTFPSEQSVEYAVNSTLISTTIAGDNMENIFYGFTPEANGENSHGNGYSYIISPNGTTNINVYYRRNSYNNTYYTNGGTHANPSTRQYQERVSFVDAFDGNLLNGVNDYNGNNNSGLGNFIGWYRDSDVTDKVNGINGEVTTNEDFYARWEQTRYTEYSNGWAWSSWGRSE